MFSRCQKIFAFVLAIGLLYGCATPSFAQGKKARQFEKMAAETGSIDGAIWSFRLEPKLQGKNSKEPLRGRMRVSDLKIFQSETPEGEMSKEIGASKPLGKERVTVAEFESLSGTTPGRDWVTLKGKAMLHADKKTNSVIGEFVDSEGLKWSMSMKRVQE